MLYAVSDTIYYVSDKAREKKVGLVATLETVRDFIKTNLRRILSSKRAAYWKFLCFSVGVVVVGSQSCFILLSCMTMSM